MFPNDPLHLLAFAHERAGELREQAAVGRLRRASATRHALASSLRCLADRLDPAPLAPKPA